LQNTLWFVACLIRFERSVKAYLSLLPTAPPLRSNIDTLISAPLAAVFEPSLSPVTQLSPLQHAVLQAVWDYTERTRTDSQMRRQLLLRLGLPDEPAPLRVLLAQPPAI
jgi:hypothetical protein